MIRTALATACVVLLCATSSRSTPPSHTTDPITEWSIVASNAAAATAMPPLRTPVTFAMLHLAMYDAVSAVAEERKPYAVAPRVEHHASAHAAAIEAGYRVLLAEFPTQGPLLQATYDKLIAELPDSVSRKTGVQLGTVAARTLLKIRAEDGRNATVPYTPESGAGAWIPTPPAFLPATTAFLGGITPFTMDGPSQFRPSGPPRLRSKKWSDDYNEVKAMGGKTGSARTPEQTETARFWEPLAGTVWPATIRRLAREQSLDLASSARFQAAAFAAFADGLIACWDAKFHFEFWRPVTAIQHGDQDGSDATNPDPAWEPLAVTPNFPEYPSGHACATAAVAYTIDDFFGGNVAIPARNVVTGQERTYRRAVDVVKEVVEARMLLGLHFRSGDEDGAEVGRKIAQQIRGNGIRPKH
jgi:PAP2 superfamily